MNKFSKIFVSSGLALASVFTVGAASNVNTVEAASDSNMESQASQPYTSYYNGYASYDPGFFITDTFKKGFESGNFSLNGYETPAHEDYAKEHQEEAKNINLYDQNLNVYSNYGLDANAQPTNANQFNLSIDDVRESYGFDYTKTGSPRSIVGQYSYDLNGYKIAFTSDGNGMITKIDFYTIAE
ncbi:immunodominant staphylococcal antigen IsaB family protein [Mammaliicoccus vitulinus]|uniref:immunodominant staphylococcal antigen IsaB family protein n=1 Tax=Mammaliicoccus vitulinus TaxID=71237 RepID=UPI003F95A5BF